MATEFGRFTINTTPERAALMSGIRQSGTAAELIVRKTLHRLGIGFSLRSKGLPGTPDIVNKRRKWAIFVHGCYWHQHKGCGKATVPKSNDAFWTEKFASNIERDIRKEEELLLLGYRVLVVWECETVDEELLVSKIREFMRPPIREDMYALDVTEYDSEIDRLWITYEYTSYGSAKRILKCGPVVGQCSSTLKRANGDSGDDPQDSYEYSWLRTKQRDDHRIERVAETKPIRTVDLFSGCGGLSLGMQEACNFLGRRHQIALAVDMNHDALQVMKANLNPDMTRETDIRALFSISSGLTRPPIRKEIEGLSSIAKQEIDILVAGPPCQGFSDLNNHTRRADDRNTLYLYVARAAAVLNPRVVIIENVPGVRFDNDERVQKTVDALLRLHYEVDADIVDLCSIGVPQQRKRHMILGVKGKKIGILDALANHEVGRKRTTRWAFEDLQDTHYDEVLFRTPSLSKENLRRIQYLFENDLYDLPNAERPVCHRDSEHSYKSMYGRLKWDEPAQTITSGYGSPGQGRYIHPGRERTLTAREAARLQFFPDYFDFSLAKNRSSLAQMIGNAVPMKLSFAVTIELFTRGVLS